MARKKSEFEISENNAAENISVPAELVDFADVLKSAQDAKRQADADAEAVSKATEAVNRARQKQTKAKSTAKDSAKVMLDQRQVLLATVADKYVGDVADPTEAAVRLVGMISGSLSTESTETPMKGMQETEPDKLDMAKEEASEPISTAVLNALERETLSEEEISVLHDYLAYWWRKGVIPKYFSDGKFHQPLSR